MVKQKQITAKMLIEDETGQEFLGDVTIQIDELEEILGRYDLTISRK